MQRALIYINYTVTPIIICTGLFFAKFIDSYQYYNIIEHIKNIAVSFSIAVFICTIIIYELYHKFIHKNFLFSLDFIMIFMGILIGKIFTIVFLYKLGNAIYYGDKIINILIWLMLISILLLFDIFEIKLIMRNYIYSKGENTDNQLTLR